MATFNKFNSFVEALAEKVHNLGSDQLKAALSSTLPVATNTVLANITQIAAVNGYPPGGIPLTTAESAQAGGVYKLTINDATLMATGGAVGPFQYVVLYNDTAANDELIGWYDYGVPLTITSGNSFIIDFDSDNGVLTII
ncbi:flagellar capping protein FliD [Nitrobacteraceae bacterium AZCC 1564]